MQEADRIEVDDDGDAQRRRNLGLRRGTESKPVFGSCTHCSAAQNANFYDTL